MKRHIVRGTVIIGLVVAGWLSSLIYPCTATHCISFFCGGVLAGWLWQLTDRLMKKHKKNKNEKEGENK